MRPKGLGDETIATPSLLLEEAASHVLYMKTRVNKDMNQKQETMIL